MILRTALAAAALTLFSPLCLAMSLSKEVTLSDGRGGQMIAVTTGELGAAGSSRSTDASFSAFTPREDGFRIEGSLRREYSREGRTTESVLSGGLTLVPGAQANSQEPLRLRIEGLSVIRDGDGPELSGSIEINGQSVPAERIPQQIRRTLRRLVGLTQL